MQQFLIHIGFTIGLTLVILVILALYIKWRLGSFSFSNAIGLGDILFLFAIAVGFPPVSYITLLAFGLVFALIIHQAISYLSKKPIKTDKTTTQHTVPLAGYLALFFCGILLVHWLGGYDLSLIHI